MINKYKLIFWMTVLLAFSVSVFADVTLQWDANTEADLDGYKVYYKLEEGGAPYDGTGATTGASPISIWLQGKNPGNLELTEDANPEITITGLEEGKVYYFVVTAFDSENLESDYSNEVNTEIDSTDVDTDGDGIPDNVDTDDDNDGMLDDWEALYGLNPLLGNDAALDNDGDILTNLQEYNLGTNPTVKEIPDRPSNVLIYME